MTEATLLSWQMAEGRWHVARQAERVGAAAKGVWLSVLQREDGPDG